MATSKTKEICCLMFLEGHGVVKALESRGTLDVLRHGFKFYGKKISMAYFKPAFGLNPEAVEKYEQNRLTVTRQVEYIKGDPRDPGIGKPDIVISLNGLPVVTMELKNQMTGQTVENARKQYMYDRDPRDTLFRFKRGALIGTSSKKSRSNRHLI